MDDELRRGKSALSVAKKFGFPKSSVYRHKDSGHHKDSVLKAKARILVDWRQDTCRPKDRKKTVYNFPFDDQVAILPSDYVFVVQREAPPVYSEKVLEMMREQAPIAYAEVLTLLNRSAKKQFIRTITTCPKVTNLLPEENPCRK
jgi:hypothetical protein